MGFLCQQPMLRLVKEALALPVGGKAIPLDAIERIVKHGNHEPLLGRAPARRSAVLRGQNDVELGLSVGCFNHFQFSFPRHERL